jgi:polyisoprenoid-binding protein YceI
MGVPEKPDCARFERPQVCRVSLSKAAIKRGDTDMKKILITAAALSLVIAVRAEIFKVDTAHAGISFAVKHLMLSNTKGSFNTFDGTVDYDLETKTLKSIEGYIEAASIDTNNEKRDDHLRNEDFFHVTEFPRITFKSTSIKKTGENTFLVEGNLNVLGVDRSVSLPVTVNGPVDGRDGAKIIGLECSTTLNRRELGITNSPAAVIGNEVKVSIEAEAIHK